MERRGSSAQRPRAGWIVRGLLAVIAVMLCYASVRFSLAQALATRDAALAHRLAPHDGRITALLAASLAGQGASEADRRRSNGLAREALAQDPTAVFAVSTLGINAQLRGDTPAARRLFGYSQMLSRRDLQTQLWAIQDAVGRGDVADALRHYDITLRVWPAMSDLLFPVLAQASPEPKVAAALARALAGRPAWGDGFVNFLAVNGRDPEATARLFLALHRAGVAIPGYARTGAIDALIARGRADAAWTYYASLHPGANPRRSRDPRFTAAPDPPSRFDWVATDDATATSTQGGAFAFTLAAGAGGPLLRQLQLLAPGRYALVGHAGGMDQAAGAKLYWALTCQDGRELGRVAMPGPVQADGSFAGRFDVPAGCPSQTLALVASASDAAAGVAGQVDRVELSPAR